MNTKRNIVGSRYGQRTRESSARSSPDEVRTICSMGIKRRLPIIRDLDDLLQHVRARPGMYMADGNDLRNLEAHVFGWEACASTHQLSDSAVGFRRAFSDYVLASNGWSTSCGWADAIARNTASADEAVRVFFALYEQFKETRKSGA